MKAELSHLKKTVSDIRSYAELYEDLYRTAIPSKDVLEIVRLKMEYCKEQMLKLSLELRNSFLDVKGGKAATAGTASALARQMLQLVNEAFSYESKKEDLFAKIEKIFLEYQSGRYTYFEYARQLDSALDGKQKEEWLASCEDSVKKLIADMMGLNNQFFYSAYRLTLQQDLRITKAPVVAEIRPIEERPMLPKLEESIRPIPEIVEEEKTEAPAELEEEPIEIAKPEIKIEEIPIETKSVEAPKPAIKVPQEQKAVYETPEEEKEVEELLSKLKSGEIKATPNVMKWLIERLKKQKPKERRTEKEMTLDPAMLKEAEAEDYMF